MRALLLAACLSGLASSAIAAPLPAGTYRLVGTEPFWDARIRPGSLTLHSDAAETTTVLRGVTKSRQGAWTVWTAGRGAKRLVMRLRPNPKCDDGMTDNYYPYDAQVLFPDGGKLEGCADSARHPRRAVQY
jgi:uncharacterized membrane protein